MENNDIKNEEQVEQLVEETKKEDPKSSEENQEVKGTNNETGSTMDVEKEKYPSSSILFKPFKEVEGKDLKDGVANSIANKLLPNNFILPSLNFKEQNNFVNDVLKDEDSEELASTVERSVSDTIIARMAKGRLSATEGSDDKTNEIFRNRLDSGSFTNSIKMDDKELNLATLTADAIAGSKQSKEELAYFRFLSTSGNGEQINIPLWHSGFRIVLKPMSTVEYASLMNIIQQDKAVFSKQIIGFMYSYDSFVINTHVLNMVSNLIVYTTLNINRKEEDIMSHISVLDLNMIYLGLLASIFSSGIEFSMQCKNVKELNEDGTVKCNNQLVGLLDPTKILWIDTDRIAKEDNKWMLKQMQKTSAASVSQEEARLYRERIEGYANIDGYTIKGNNPKLKKQHISQFMFKIPSLYEYMNVGETWKACLEEEVRRALGNTDSSQPTDDEAIQSIYSILTTSRYLPFIDKIQNKIEGEEDEGSNSEITDPEYLLKAMVSIISKPTRDNKLKYQELEESITKNIEDATVAIMAIPTFKCSKCGASKEAQQVFKSDRLKDLIPLDGLYTFFDVAELLSQDMG